MHSSLLVARLFAVDIWRGDSVGCSTTARWHVAFCGPRNSRFAPTRCTVSNLRPIFGESRSPTATKSRKHRVTRICGLRGSRWTRACPRTSSPGEGGGGASGIAPRADVLRSNGAIPEESPLANQVATEDAWRLCHRSGGFTLLAGTLLIAVLS